MGNTHCQKKPSQNKVLLDREDVDETHEETTGLDYIDGVANSVRADSNRETCAEYLESLRDAPSIITDMDEFRQQTGLQLPNGDLRTMNTETSRMKAFAVSSDKFLHCCKRQSRESVTVVRKPDDDGLQTFTMSSGQDESQRMSQEGCCATISLPMTTDNMSHHLVQAIQRQYEARMSLAVERLTQLESQKRTRHKLFYSNARGKTFQSVNDMMIGLQDDLEKKHNLCSVDCNAGNSMGESPELYARLQSHPSGKVGFTGKVGVHLSLQELGFITEEDEDLLEKVLDGSWDGRECCEVERVAARRKANEEGVLSRVGSTKLSRSSTATTLPQGGNLSSSSKLTPVGTPKDVAATLPAEDCSNLTSQPVLPSQEVPDGTEASNHDALSGKLEQSLQGADDASSQPQSAVVSGILLQLQNQNKQKKMQSPAGQTGTDALMKPGGNVQRAAKSSGSPTKRGQARGDDDGLSVMDPGHPSAKSFGRKPSLVKSGSTRPTKSDEQSVQSKTLGLPAKSSSSGRKQSRTKDAPSIISTASKTSANVVNLLGPYAQQVPNAKTK
eukprot:gnl/MRDRNA2_/MRDRNA2_109489_c0_seq1.p1 gnl/MRDRNA2_/MRDRNA2_109489_c0~~gnl/MRDRNA2_/MRDRNA2_109489_c0_seq1.p1  ORF type:complete len:557 (+),score=125.27 gnl/MRDRNA2_/MRDRNA2_109489_c0_seq1:103-1773(+)